MTAIMTVVFLSTLCFNIGSGIHFLGEFNEATNKQQQLRQESTHILQTKFSPSVEKEDVAEKNTSEKEEILELPKTKVGILDKLDEDEILVLPKVKVAILDRKKKVNFTEGFVNEVVDIESFKNRNEVLTESTWDECANNFGWELNNGAIEANGLTEEDIRERIGRFYLKIGLLASHVQDLFKDDFYEKNIKEINDIKDLIVKAIDEFYNDGVLSDNNEFKYLYNNVDVIYNTMRLENDKLHKIYTNIEFSPFTYRFYKDAKVIYTENDEEDSVKFSVFSDGRIE